MSMIPGSFAHNGLSLHAYQPIFVPGTPTFTPRADIAAWNLKDGTVTYSQTVTATEGWKEAAIKMIVPLDDLWDWMINGPSRHIEVYGSDLTRIFAGFVNEIVIGLGGATITIGPVVDIANRVLSTYTALDVTVTPPINGPSGIVTALAENAASQIKHGIWEKNIDAGTTLPANATQARDMFLAERQGVAAATEISRGGGFQIELSVLGYWAYFLTWSHEQVAAGGTRQIDQKIQDIVGTDPNGVFSTNYTRIAANATLVSRYEDTDTIAWEQIKSLVSLGDAAGNRYIVGVYDDQQVVYEAVDDSVTYMQYLSEADTIRSYGSGAVVDPWTVLPGRWLFYADLMPGTPLARTVADRRDDIRYELIESVTFTDAGVVTHTGGKINTLAQALARWGLSGAAA